MSDEDNPFGVDTSRTFGGGLVGRPRAMRHAGPRNEAAADDTEPTEEPPLTPEELVARLGTLEPEAAKALLDREEAKRAARTGE